MHWNHENMKAFEKRIPLAFQRNLTLVGKKRYTIYPANVPLFRYDFDLLESDKQFLQAVFKCQKLSYDHRSLIVKKRTNLETKTGF